MMAKNCRTWLSALLMAVSCAVVTPALASSAQGLPTPVQNLPRPVQDIPGPDLVLVEKSEKKLYLLRQGEVIREYPIALGKNPVGHKLEEGDGRTPEGRYVLDWRNPESKFHRSIHISYPNDRDKRSAEDRQKPPGAHIMIHGSPDWVPSSEWAANWLQKEDWTDGCIAVTNEQMDEIWKLVADGTPIEIQP